MKNHSFLLLSLLSFISFGSLSEEAAPLYNVEVTVVEIGDSLEITHRLNVNARDGVLLTNKNTDSIPFVKSESKTTSWWHSFVWWDPEIERSYSAINAGMSFSAYLKKNNESLTVSLSTNYVRLKSIEAKIYGDLTIETPLTTESSYDGSFFIDYPVSDKSCKTFSIGNGVSQSICVSLAS